MKESSFQFDLDMDSAIILANMKKEDKNVQNQYEQHINNNEYIYLESPVKRIKETNY